MKRVASFLLTAAAAAFIFPVSVMPDAFDNCADPSWRFLTNGPNSTTITDTSTARSSFCRVLADYERLY